jgi:hypothetical protein
MNIANQEDINQMDTSHIARLIANTATAHWQNISEGINNFIHQI